MNFSEYQRSAKETINFDLGGPKSAIAPMLGLASETGQILNVYKKFLRDGLDLEANREFLKVELGDLLWYVSAVATAMELNMEEVAKTNLERIHDRFRPPNASAIFQSMTPLDANYPDQERFPRRLTVQFVEDPLPSGRCAVSLTLVSAEPNAFPDGPIEVGGKKVGFTLGGSLGDPLTDNSRRVDDYRFHDAIHMGFMTVLGWSPTMRSLLRLKRKSNPETDQSEDGARAVFAEEGLAAILARLAELRTGFQREASFDGDAVNIVKAATVGLEAAKLPAWLWRIAVNQGFSAMRRLAENKGGYLIADLDERKLTFCKTLSPMDSSRSLNRSQ